MALALNSPAPKRSVPPGPTLAFYDREAADYCRDTRGNDLGSLYPVLLDRVPPGGLLLDAGSGSGRDTLAFLRRGFRVEAFDASRPMAELATELTGVTTQVATFETWAGAPARYDGIWAFASLLHVARDDLPGAVSRLADSLKPDGHMFASFKWGKGDRTDARGRRYTDMTVPAARALIDALPSLTPVRVWRELGPTALDRDASWTYLLARREGE